MSWSGDWKIAGTIKEKPHIRGRMRQQMWGLSNNPVA
jgi:hypothetical protein